MKYELIIFDLDGTLIDTSIGIFNSVRYAEEKMGLFPVEDECLKRFVGPPPKLMYMKIYNLNEEVALEAAKYHREYGRMKAISEGTTYQGIKNMLEELKKKNYKLAVATLKSQKIAEEVLNIHDLRQYFDTVVGMDEDETYTKEMTIKKAIIETHTEGNVVMVGDSEYDLNGAIAANVDFIGVLYGFGFDESFFDNKSNVEFVQTPKDILKILKLMEK